MLNAKRKDVVKCNGGGANREMLGQTTDYYKTHKEERNHKSYYLRFINNLFNVFYINVFISKLDSFLAPSNNLSLMSKRLNKPNAMHLVNTLITIAATISHLNKQTCYNDNESST